MAEVLRSRCVVLCTGVSLYPKHVELFIIINKLLHQVGISRQNTGTLKWDVIKGTVLTASVV